MRKIAVNFLNCFTLLRNWKRIFLLFLCLPLLNNPLEPHNQTLAPYSKTSDFGNWVIQSEQFVRDYIGANLRLTRSARSFRSFRRTIARLRTLGDKETLTNEEKIFLIHLLEHLHWLAKNNLIFKHVGFVRDHANDFLAGIAYPNKIGVGDFFFNRHSALFPHLPLALLTLATRSLYLALPEHKRDSSWNFRLEQLARKLFNNIPDFDQALWEWRIQTQLQEMGKDPWKYRKSPPPMRISSTTYHDENEEQLVISTLSPDRKISGLQKAAQYVNAQFDEGRKFVFLGLADDYPNQVLTLRKMAHFLYEVIDADSRPTHIVFQIPKFRRVNIKRIYERLVSTGKGLRSGEFSLLQKAFQTRKRGLKIRELSQLMTLFKMFYYFNFYPPIEDHVQVVVLNENEHQAPQEFVLFKQTVLETVLKNPEARVLLVTELKHAERNSALRSYFQELFPEEVMRSFIVSPANLLDGDFLGVTLEELNYEIDFVLKGLPDIEAIKKIKVKQSKPFEFKDFDALICFTDPRTDNDGQGPKNDEDDVEDLPPYVDDPSSLPIPVGGDDAGPDWELALLAQFTWDDEDDDLFGRSL